MINTILYFHGFASSSDSDKAKIIKSHISKISKKIKVLTPDLSNDFIEANNQINKLINVSILSAIETIAPFLVEGRASL